MHLKILHPDKNEQTPLTASPLLKRWVRARERLALIRSQERPWAGRNEPTTVVGFSEPGTDG